MWIPLTLIALIAPAQEAEPVRQELPTMHYFTPESDHLLELYDQARDLFRRSVLRPSGDPQDGLADNLFLLGDSIVVYDTPAYADAVLSGLSEMQKAWNKASGAPSGAGGGGYTDEFVSAEVRVTHLSAMEGYTALQQHYRQLSPSSGNVQMVEDRGVILLRDSERRVAEMRAILERLDRPEPQVQLQFLVLHARPDTEVDGSHDARIPAPLVSGLADLLPGMVLEMRSTAFLRTTAAEGVTREVSLPMDGTKDSYGVRLLLGALDERSGTLNLLDCGLSEYGPGGRLAHFTTGTSIPMNEYVVIGANGASPTLLVVRATRADGGAAKRPVKGSAH